MEGNVRSRIQLASKPTRVHNDFLVTLNTNRNDISDGVLAETPYEQTKPHQMMKLFLGQRPRILRELLEP